MIHWHAPPAGFLAVLRQLHVCRRAARCATIATEPPLPVRRATVSQQRAEQWPGLHLRHQRCEDDEPVHDREREEPPCGMIAALVPYAQRERRKRRAGADRDDAVGRPGVVEQAYQGLATAQLPRA